MAPSKTARRPGGKPAPSFSRLLILGVCRRKRGERRGLFSPWHYTGGLDEVPGGLLSLPSRSQRVRKDPRDRGEEEGGRRAGRDKRDPTHTHGHTHPNTNQPCKHKHTRPEKTAQTHPVSSPGIDATSKSLPGRCTHTNNLKPTPWDPPFPSEARPAVPTRGPGARGDPTRRRGRGRGSIECLRALSI